MIKTSEQVDLYIGNFPTAVRDRLQRIRNLIHAAAPQAEESLAYGMPAYKFNKKPLVYFGGFKNHIGLYALPSGHAYFKSKLLPYKQGKGSVQFPHEQPLPLELIQEIIHYRIKENQ